MKNNFFSAKRLCRVGVIAALYTALTYAFGWMSFGPFQIRPSEAFCLLPLLFPESILSLFIGCALSNIASPFGFWDIALGSLTTLLAALCTYFIGKAVKNEWAKLIFGGIFPVLFNALIIPLIMLLLYDGAGDVSFAAYILQAGSIFLTQFIWVYGLGIPLYFTVKKLSK